MKIIKNKKNNKYSKKNKKKSSNKKRSKKNSNKRYSNKIGGNIHRRHTVDNISDINNIYNIKYNVNLSNIILLNQSYKISELIGSGTFGEVYLLKRNQKITTVDDYNISNKDEYVIKIYDIISLSKSSIFKAENIISEIKLWKLFSDNLIGPYYYGSIININKYIYGIILKKYNNFVTYLINITNNTQIDKITSQITILLDKLTNLRYICGDIKPDNFLIDKDENVVISDIDAYFCCTFDETQDYVQCKLIDNINKIFNENIEKKTDKSTKFNIYEMYKILAKLVLFFKSQRFINNKLNIKPLFNEYIFNLSDNLLSQYDIKYENLAKLGNLLCNEGEDFDSSEFNYCSNNIQFINMFNYINKEHYLYNNMLNYKIKYIEKLGIPMIISPEKTLLNSLQIIEYMKNNKIINMLNHIDDLSKKNKSISQSDSIEENKKLVDNWDSDDSVWVKKNKSNNAQFYLTDNLSKQNILKSQNKSIEKKKELIDNTWDSVWEEEDKPENIGFYVKK